MAHLGFVFNSVNMTVQLTPAKQDCISTLAVPDSEVHGANMGPIWGHQDPGGPHVGLMNFAIWGVSVEEW